MPLLAISPIVSRRSAVGIAGGGLITTLLALSADPVRAQDLETLDANKAIVRRVIEEGLNDRNGKVLADLYLHNPADRARVTNEHPGPAGLPMAISEFALLFPNVQGTIEFVIGEEDLVAAFVTWIDKHPPTGTHLVGHTMHIFRVTSSLISEELSVGWDWLDRTPRAPISHPPNPLAIG